MIRISKPDKPPAILADKGKKKRRGLSAAYSRSPQAYRDGTKTFQFDSGVYGHRTVKDALVNAQHGKCCFCESRVRHVAFGDVEHFRPKAGYQQSTGEPVGKPGYYWLAYEWTNLLFACQVCNTSGKGNQFPLRDPNTRAICHHDDMTREEPLLLNPAEVDPEEHISFRQEIACAAGDSRAGRTTIEVLKLNREALVERRRDRLAHLRCLHDIVNLDLPRSLSEAARTWLEKALADSAEYAAMARAAVAARFSPLGQ